MAGRSKQGGRAKAPAKEGKPATERKPAKEGEPASEGDRRLPYGVLWALFITSLLVGAGLTWDPDPDKRAWGLFLMVAPLVVFGLLMALFYWRSRRVAAQ